MGIGWTPSCRMKSSILEVWDVQDLQDDQDVLDDQKVLDVQEVQEVLDDQDIRDSCSCWTSRKAWLWGQAMSKPKSQLVPPFPVTSGDKLCRPKPN